MHWLALLFLLTAHAWLPAFGPLSADQVAPGVQINSPSATFQFGNQVTFRASLQSTQASEQVLLYVGAANQVVQIYPVTRAPDGSLVYTLDLHEDALRPFTRVYYWFKVKYKNDGLYTSPSFWFDYTDNRFTWQNLDSNLFHIHWIDGDDAFGQAILDVAQTGFKTNQGILPVAPPTTPINIYVYAHAKDLQSALELGGMNWVAGEASPDLGVVLISIPTGPDQRLSMEQQIPHELSHVLLYQITGSAYSHLPAWLVEGLASIVELYPESEYPHALQVANQDRTLIPISSLCQAFPRDASNAFLAYAESESFVRYLNTNYGVSTLQRMIQRYLDGMGCSEGASAATGVPLDKLDSQWQQQVLGVNITGLALNKLLPYLLVAALLLLPSLGAGIVYHRNRG